MTETVATNTIHVVWKVVGPWLVVKLDSLSDMVGLSECLRDHQKIRPWRQNIRTTQQKQQDTGRSTNIETKK